MHNSIESCERLLMTGILFLVVRECLNVDDVMHCNNKVEQLAIASLIKIQPDNLLVVL